MSNPVEDAIVRPTLNGIVLSPWSAVYVPIPKVACTSLLDVARRWLGLDGEVHASTAFTRVPLYDLGQLCPPNRVYAFVRNPWDRLLSCYLDKLDPDQADNRYWRNGVEINFWPYGGRFHAGMSFAEFVRAVTELPESQANVHFAPQSWWLDVPVDFLGRFERLDGDYQRLRAWLGLPDESLPRHRATNHGHYSRYYDADSRERAGRYYAADIERLGYAFATAGAEVQAAQPRR